jgi:hypothetical protein
MGAKPEAPGEDTFSVYLSAKGRADQAVLASGRSPHPRLGPCLVGSLRGGAQMCQQDRVSDLGQRVTGRDRQTLCARPAVAPSRSGPPQAQSARSAQGPHDAGRPSGLPVHWPLWPAPFPPLVGGGALANAGADTESSPAVSSATTIARTRRVIRDHLPPRQSGANHWIWLVRPQNAAHTSGIPLHCTASSPE